MMIYIIFNKQVFLDIQVSVLTVDTVFSRSFSGNHLLLEKAHRHCHNNSTTRDWVVVTVSVYTLKWFPNLPHKALVDPGKGSFTCKVNRCEWDLNCDRLCVAVEQTIIWIWKPNIYDRVCSPRTSKNTNWWNYEQRRSVGNKHIL